MHPEYAALQGTLTTINEKQQAQGTPDARAGQIALNLERWRWLPDDLGPRHILVNVPAFYMAARENGKPVLEMKVIVGKPENATPIFSDEMETVVFSPYWNVPDSIAEGETAPSAARDPSFLRAPEHRDPAPHRQRHRDRWIPRSVNWDDPEAIKELAFRQKPGAKNALGHVKFLFPNPHDVYLHDTPADALFFREGRALSHGCIRLEMPEELARYMLRDKPEWTDDKIKEAMYAGEEKHVALKEKVPVHIVYFTVWPKGDGDVDLFDDIYGYDAKQSGAAAGRRKVEPAIGIAEPALGLVSGGLVRFRGWHAAAPVPTLKARVQLSGRTLPLVALMLLLLGALRTGAPGRRRVGALAWPRTRGRQDSIGDIRSRRVRAGA